MSRVQVQLEKIKYEKPDFAIHHLIEDCPAHTVVRELLKNAEESAIQINPPGRIEWFFEKVDGVRKLGLFNEGPGMSNEDLFRLTDMASTGKTLGVDNNFGQGGKVSALKVSPAGVEYRSCKNGRVCRIVLAAEREAGVDHPVYVKQRRHIVDEQGDTWETVLDVTDDYRGRTDRPLDRDWTEVVLLGKKHDQDTVAELLPDAARKNWLIRHINQRFFRFPPGVTVHNADASSGQRNVRNALGLEDVTLRHCKPSDGGRHEDVAATHPVYGEVTIRYCKLKGSWNGDAEGESRAKTMEAYGVGTRGDHVCLVWRNECYEVRTGWSSISGPFGVVYGSANVTIQILLPDDAPIKNNTYRDKLLRRDEDGGHYVTMMEFAELARENRPAWLVQYVEEEGRQDSPASNVMDRLRRFLAELMASGERRAAVEPGGDDEGEQAGGGGKGGEMTATATATGRKTRRKYDIPPVAAVPDRLSAASPKSVSPATRPSWPR